jgi:hypothetical protein
MTTLGTAATQALARGEEIAAQAGTVIKDGVTASIVKVKSAAGDIATNLKNTTTGGSAPDYDEQRAQYFWQQTTSTPQDPLAKLASGGAPGNKKIIQTLSYPRDLVTNPRRASYVQFWIKDVKSGTYNQGTDQTNLVVLGPNAAAAATQAIDGLEIPQGTPGLLTAGLEMVKSGAEQGIQFLQQGLTISPAYTESLAYISLYMPDTLSTSFSSDYSAISLRNEVGPVVRKIRTTSQLAEKGIGTEGNLIDKIKSLSNEPALVEAVFNSSQRLGTSQSFSSALLQGQGYAVNPQMQMIYQGIGMRSFSLSFIFTPSSAEESETVKNIIYTLKYYSAPELQNVKQSYINNLYMIPPSVFNVYFKINDVENVYLPKYGDCVLENMEVNYAPNGFSTHIDGAPVQTTLTLTFKEIESIHKHKLSTGYNDPQASGGLR